MSELGLNHRLRIIFMGTSDFGCPCLHYLLSDHAKNYDVCAVYTSPPRRAGRGMKQRLSPIHDYAKQFEGIEIRTPETLSSGDVIEAFALLEADIALVISYGLLLPSSILSLPNMGCFNIHASLLPRWRGAAPIERAVLAGDKETGVSTMRMVEELDGGDICGVRHLTLTPSMTAGDVSAHLAKLSVELLDEFLQRLKRGEKLYFTPQDETGVSYAKKISRSEAQIDWSLPCDSVRDHIHGFSPRPGAWSYYIDGGGKRIELRVLRCICVEDMRGVRHGGERCGHVLSDSLVIACGEGAVRVLEVQRAGRSVMDGDAFLRGTPLPIGTVFGAL